MKAGVALVAFISMDVAGLRYTMLTCRRSNPSNPSASSTSYCLWSGSVHKLAGRTVQVCCCYNAAGQVTGFTGRQRNPHSSRLSMTLEYAGYSPSPAFTLFRQDHAESAGLADGTLSKACGFLYTLICSACIIVKLSHGACNLSRAHLAVFGGG